MNQNVPRRKLQFRRFNAIMKFSTIIFDVHSC